MDRDNGLKSAIAAIGQKLGSLYWALWQDVVRLHTCWDEYVELFGTSPERIDLLNKAAPTFFRMLQDTLFDNTLLHISRVTDRSRSSGHENLSIRAIPPFVAELAARHRIQALVDAAVNEAEFSRDWRNRRIAHSDLDLALAKNGNTPPIKPLEQASRQLVKGAISAIEAVLNALANSYQNSELMFWNGFGASGAVSLLYVIDDGVKAEAERYERLKRGDFRPGDRDRKL
jgi:hypothetical protein